MTRSAWIYRPWLDLTVGCGAWSAPLLLLVYVLAAPDVQTWALAFYALALVFNYPHFMATIYRAYGSRQEFSKYRVFTVHFTVFLLVTGVLVHLSPTLAPWLFTVYITWSPWHYTGQNYGLLMMFARRNGAAPTAGERRALYGSFVASYVMLFLSFHSGLSLDRFVISLGIPNALAFWGQLVAAAMFVVLGVGALWRFTRRIGLAAMSAPLTLFVTQVLWFVLPTALERGYGLDIPQARYSSGMLAILHATQYLWITSYYARREAAGQGVWRPWSYFLALVVGGIALFIPGPWLVSYVFRYDFATSFMMFTALVNIHHFILDGAIWKLRDGRIAALLLDTRERVATTTEGVGSVFGAAAGWLLGATRGARLVRVGAVLSLCLIAGLDQVRYYLGLDGANVSGLRASARLNPYDPTVQTRLARLLSQTGDDVEAETALRRAVALDPTEPVAQHRLGQILVESERRDEAYAHYQQMVGARPRDADALVNLGILAREMGNDVEAIEWWRQAVTVDPAQVQAHLYVAELFEGRGELEASLPHYQAYLGLVAARRGVARPAPGAVVAVVLKFADVQERIGRIDEALALVESAIGMARQTGETELERLAESRRDALLRD